ncbi:hypothetical protein ACFSTC_56945 [Nonomuraea ferruginea]
MRAKLGVTALALLFLAGLWLVAAPFVVGYQPRGAALTAATVNDLWIGGALAGWVVPRPRLVRGRPVARVDDPARQAAS